MNMNYIVEIKAFQGFVQDKSLSTGQITLWYSLMYINNKTGWSEWFTAANLSLELNSGLSRQGIVKARNVLKQLNLIDFKSNGTKAASYKMLSLAKFIQSSLQENAQVNTEQLSPTLDSIQDGVQSGVQNSIQNGLQNGIQKCVQDSIPLNKPNKNKTKRNNNIFIPPTFDEINNCCLERNSNVDPKSFFDYFNASSWVDSRGNKVKNWKQKVIVWEKHNISNNNNTSRYKNMSVKASEGLNNDNSSFDITEIEKMILAKYQ